MSPHDLETCFLQTVLHVDGTIHGAEKKYLYLDTPRGFPSSVLNKCSLFQQSLIDHLVEENKEERDFLRVIRTIGFIAHLDGEIHRKESKFAQKVLTAFGKKSDPTALFDATSDITYLLIYNLPVTPEEANEYGLDSYKKQFQYKELRGEIPKNL